MPCLPLCAAHMNDMSPAARPPRTRKPDWIRVKAPTSVGFAETRKLMRDKNLQLNGREVRSLIETRIALEQLMVQQVIERSSDEGLRARIDAQIVALARTRELLDNCIGCGCLSLNNCGLYNRADKAAQRGAGPRYLLGDRAMEIAEV